MNDKQRWIEICFVYLVQDVYSRLNQYPMVVNYLYILADIAKVDRNQTLRVLQKVTQINHIRPSKIEYVWLAKKHDQTIIQITKTLKISKSTYLDLYHLAEQQPLEIFARCTPNEIAIMEVILKAHNIIKECGI